MPHQKLQVRNYFYIQLHSGPGIPLGCAFILGGAKLQTDILSKFHSDYKYEASTQDLLRELAQLSSEDETMKRAFPVYGNWSFFYETIARGSYQGDDGKKRNWMQERKSLCCKVLQTALKTTTGPPPDSPGAGNVILHLLDEPWGASFYD